jgi:hypothetical protein
VAVTCRDEVVVVVHCGEVVVVVAVVCRGDVVVVVVTARCASHGDGRTSW